MKLTENELHVEEWYAAEYQLNEIWNQKTAWQNQWNKIQMRLCVNVFAKILGNYYLLHFRKQLLGLESEKKIEIKNNKK
jgi:hypothetical protein